MTNWEGKPSHKALYQVVALAVCLLFSTARADNPKPGSLRIMTTPSDCVIMINDSIVKDFKKNGGWLELMRPPGMYKVSASAAKVTDSFHIEIFEDQATCRQMTKYWSRPNDANSAPVLKR